MESKEILDMEKRIADMWERMQEKDMEAAKVLEEKDALMEEYAPLNVALHMKTEVLVRLSLEKEVMLREMWKYTKTLIALEGEKNAEGMHR